MIARSSGPWIAEFEIKPPMRAFCIRSSDGRVVARYLGYDDHLRFADDVAKPEDVEGNGRLIAAAPEMLKALEEIIAAAFYLKEESDDMVVDVEHINAARIILAKGQS